jgi:hypothetical protein
VVKDYFAEKNETKNPKLLKDLEIPYFPSVFSLFLQLGPDYLDPDRACNSGLVHTQRQVGFLRLNHSFRERESDEPRDEASLIEQVIAPSDLTSPMSDSKAAARQGTTEVGQSVEKMPLVKNSRCKASPWV